MQRYGNGWHCAAPTITELMRAAIRGHLDCPDPDAILNIETHLFNVTLEAASCEYSLDLGKDVWLNRQRWSRLIKEYVPREPLDRFVAQAVEILSGEARLGATANMMFRDPDRYAKKHRWGGCLMGATFRGDNAKSGKATLTLYSRTTYMGYMALLDAGIANRIAAEIIARWAESSSVGRGFLQDDELPIAFRWHISSQQLHCFKTLPYIYSRPALMQRLERLERNRGLLPKQTPTWRHLGKWFCKVADAWDKHKTFQGVIDDEKYGPYKRNKRRWMEHMGYSQKNLPPSCPVDSLTFEKSV